MKTTGAQRDFSTVALEFFTNNRQYALALGTVLESGKRLTKHHLGFT
tara:strand:- start:304 stop:444 length:141 start_codon:yes stop_codon:yes gene_type:complete